MTEIRFFKAQSGWRGFEAEGHAGYAEYGEDVVCAAVSVLTQTAIIGLCKVLSIDCELDLDEESGTMFCLLPADLSPEKWQQAQLVLEILYAGLLDISTNEDYQRYVSLKEVPYREN
ncbi:MAG: ribosomal-processing cysteine protease Prp [Firmicutes bacterium]|jgi:uncharacterized protein YsxB (DUF464 family)|nr:ribosomal-processing cysteine protease Prp [Bacillota bacterium]NLO66681.1 ribosomal-processing cysteine protease Prp [Bacillota bacterium]